MRTLFVQYTKIEERFKQFLHPNHFSPFETVSRKSSKKCTSTASPKSNHWFHRNQNLTNQTADYPVKKQHKYI